MIHSKLEFVRKSSHLSSFVPVLLLVLLVEVELKESEGWSRFPPVLSGLLGGRSRARTYTQVPPYVSTRLDQRLDGDRGVPEKSGRRERPDVTGPGYPGSHVRAPL